MTFRAILNSSRNVGKFLPALFLYRSTSIRNLRSLYYP
jgi:hypothetical protein